MSFKEFKEFWINFFASYASGYSGIETSDGKKIVLGGEPISTVIIEGAGYVPFGEQSNLENDKKDNV